MSTPPTSANMSPRRYSMPEQSLIVDFPATRRRSSAAAEIASSMQNLDINEQAVSRGRAENIPEEPRRVRFSTKNRMKNIDKPSLEEFDVRWYQKKDKKRFKKAIMQDTKRMAEILASASGEEISSDVLTSCVGIELFLSPGLARRAKEKRMLHSQIILEEISRQEELNIEDDKRIRKLSERSSKWSRERAHDLAVGYWEIFDE
ncbi:hypothetical protein ACHAXS_002786 [Conticribra weissflogii]